MIESLSLLSWQASKIESRHPWRAFAAISEPPSKLWVITIFIYDFSDSTENAPDKPACAAPELSIFEIYCIAHFFAEQLRH